MPLAASKRTRTQTRRTGTGATSKAARLHHAIARNIRLAINDQAIKVGDQLPTEVQLSAQYGVSRSTVRLALKELEDAGLITRTRSRGTFLTRRMPAKRTKQRTSLSSASSRTIGVVLRFSAETDALQTGILLGVEHAAQSRGYNIAFARTDDGDEQKEANAIEKLLNMDVAGIVIMPISERAWTPGVQSIVDRKTPLVLVDRYLSGLNTSYVTSDNFAGGYRATEHLIILGYTTFTFAVHYPTEDMPVTTTVRDRYRSFCAALEHYGLEELIQPPVYVNTNQQDAVAQLVDAAVGKNFAHPTAIVAANDGLAIKIINAAADMGKHPPEHFAIVGYDDLPMAKHVSTPLTTVLQPRYDQGFQAGHLLLDKVEGFPVRKDKIVLPVSLVVRESCGARQLVHQQRAGT
jgi:DNA-binding LacI/PurR family transcriptional regulator